MIDVFTEYAPAHERYGYGSLEVGARMEIPLGKRSPSVGKVTAKIIQIRSGVSSYGKYYGKRFKTKVVGDTLHIMRVE